MVFEENKEIPDEQWNYIQPVKLNTRITDNSVPVNFYINVRQTANYPYSNLYLLVSTKFPDGKLIKDTLECILADESGKWLGKGAGHLLDNRIPFKKNVLFPDTGIYQFEIEQLMRMEKIPEIVNIGFRIEKAKNP